MQCKDIPDHLILFLGTKESIEDRSGGGWWMMKVLGLPPKLIESKLNKSKFDDFTEYGTGMFTYWLTLKGEQELERMNKEKCGHESCPVCSGFL